MDRKVVCLSENKSARWSFKKKEIVKRSAEIGARTAGVPNKIDYKCIKKDKNNKEYRKKKKKKSGKREKVLRIKVII